MFIWEFQHLMKREIGSEDGPNIYQKQEKLFCLIESWYTRALIEPTLGYCTKPQYEDFMTKVNDWERKLIKNGTEIVKFYFSIDKEQQKEE